MSRPPVPPPTCGAGTTVADTEWERAFREAQKAGLPLPALVVTMRDPDGAVSAQLVLKRGQSLMAADDA